MDYSLLRLNKLYVLGNGFDIHHDIKCKYSDYRRWLKKNRPEVFNNLTRLYGQLSGKWWRNFEENLTEFKPDAYPKRLPTKGFMSQLSFLADMYGQKGRDFMDEYQERMRKFGGVTNEYHKAAAVAGFEMRQLKDDLCDSFGEWVKSLEIPSKCEKVELDQNAMFFTFNYTRTLEDLYDIDEDQVLHLHGSVDSNRFVIGHNMTADQMQDRDLLRHAKRRNPYKDKGEDEARLAMFQVLEDELKKPVDEIIDENSSDFNALSDFEIVEILGLSYSPIDLPYLDKIFEVTGPDIKVKMGFHSEDDKNSAQAYAKKARLSNYELLFF